MKAPGSPLCRTAFTLMEMIIAILLISILALALVGGLQHSRSLGLEARCVSNLRQLAQGALLYAQDHGGRLPPVRDGPGNIERRRVWSFHICPYVGVENYTGPNYAQHMQKTIFWCPADQSEWQPESYSGKSILYATKNSYLANNAIMDEYAQDVDFDGVIGPRYLSNITHPGQTIMLMEGGHSLWNMVGYHSGAFSFFAGRRPGNVGYQSTPENLAGYHRGASLWAFADGHVARLRFDETYGPGFNYWLADK